MRSISTRRKFLEHTSRTSLVLSASAALGGVQTFAADTPEKLRLGIIGCGGIMKHHVQGLVTRREAVSITWLCDVDPAQIERMDRIITRDFQTAPPQRTARFEAVIEDKDVDAVIIATPHHWHAPIAVAAMVAGKDCYIEKPISHVFNEGPLIIAAATKYGRVVQQGSQMRNSPVTAKAEKLLREGIIGDVRVARAWTAETRTVEKPAPDGQPPQGVDYDRWLGPAPKRPFKPHRWHQTWRMFRAYGNGEIGDDGIHDIDMATWGLGVTTLPKQITARGSRMLLDGHASEYPDNSFISVKSPFAPVADSISIPGHSGLSTATKPTCC